MVFWRWFLFLLPLAHCAIPTPPAPQNTMLQAMHQSVQQWWNMPEGNPWSYAPVLHTFQVKMATAAPQAHSSWCCSYPNQ